MASSIDDLFEKIIHSEKVAQERKTFLTELKQQIQSAKDNLLQQNLRRKTLLKTVAEKEEQLNLGQLNLAWQTSTEQIYREQRDLLQDHISQIRDNALETEEKIAALKHKLCKELEEFSADFGIAENGSQQRNLAAKERLEAARIEAHGLEKELQKYNREKKQFDKATDERQALQNQLSQLTESNKCLDEDLRRELHTTAGLEEDKAQVSGCPQLNPEFINLQTEVSDARQKSSELEDKCSRLQEEYKCLQQYLWQQQVEWRKQHYHHQQQTQKQPASADNADSEYGMELMTDIFDDDLDDNDSITQPGRPRSHKMIFTSKKAYNQ